jgi:hypothetical protein
MLDEAQGLLLASLAREQALQGRSARRLVCAIGGLREMVCRAELSLPATIAAYPLNSEHKP